MSYTESLRPENKMIKVAVLLLWLSFARPITRNEGVDKGICIRRHLERCVFLVTTPHASMLYYCSSCCHVIPLYKVTVVAVGVLTGDRLMLILQSIFVDERKRYIRLKEKNGVRT